MSWVAWRQQRTETLIAAAILAALAALLIPTGIQMASAYHHDGLAACLGSQPPGPCDAAINSFQQRFGRLGDFISWFTLVPGLIGILLAAPFILQLEHGTYRLDWTQGITRGRWIAGKLGMAVAAAVLAALSLTLLITWWRTPFVHLQGRMDNSVYDAEGTVVIGYILFALGLATAVGVVWRRAVPALVVGFAGYFVARLFVDTWLRQRLMAPLSTTWHANGSPPAKLNHAWVLSENPSDRFGHAIGALVKPCAPAPKGGSACVANAGPTYMHAVYHPASQFWPLQGIETGIFTGAALALLLFAAWWTHQRAA
jgi:hypothetical protein